MNWVRKIGPKDNNKSGGTNKIKLSSHLEDKVSGSKSKKVKIYYKRKKECNYLNR